MEWNIPIAVISVVVVGISVYFVYTTLNRFLFNRKHTTGPASAKQPATTSGNDHSANQSTESAPVQDSTASGSVGTEPQHLSAAKIRTGRNSSTGGATASSTASSSPKPVRRTGQQQTTNKPAPSSPAANSSGGTMTASSSTMDRYRAKCDRLRLDVLRLNSSLVEKDGQLQQMQEEQQQLRQSYQELSATCSSVEDENGELHVQLCEALGKVAKQELEIAELEQRVEAQSQQLQQSHSQFVEAEAVRDQDQHQHQELATSWNGRIAELTKELREARSTAHQLELEKSMQSREVDALQRRLSGAEREIKSLSQQLASVQSELDASLQQQEQRSTQSIQKLETDLDELASKYRTAGQQLQQAEEEASRHRNAATVLERQYEDLQQSNQFTQKQLATLQRKFSSKVEEELQRNDELEQSRNEVEKLQELYKRNQTEVEELQFKYKTLLQEYNHRYNTSSTPMQTELSCYDIAQVFHQVETLTNEHKQHLLKEEELNLQVQSLQTVASERQAQAEAQVQEIRELKVKLSERQVSEAEKERKIQLLHQAHVRSNSLHLQELHSAQNRQEAELHQSKVRAEQLAEELVEEYRHKLLLAQNDADEKQNQLWEADALITQLQREMDNQVADINEKRKTIRQLKSHVVGLWEVCSSLNVSQRHHEKPNMGDTDEVLQRAGKELHRLEKRYRHLASQLEQTEQEKAAADVAVKELKQQLQSAQEHAAGVELENAEVKMESQHLRQQMAQLSSEATEQLNTMQLDIESQFQVGTTLRSQLDEANYRLQLARQEHDKQSTAMTNLQKELEERKKTIETLKERAQQEAEETEKSQHLLETRLLQLEQQIESLHSHHQADMREIDQGNSRIASLEEQIQVLEAQAVHSQQHFVEVQHRKEVEHEQRTDTLNRAHDKVIHQMNQEIQMLNRTVRDLREQRTEKLFRDLDELAADGPNPTTESEVKYLELRRMNEILTGELETVKEAHLGRIQGLEELNVHLQSELDNLRQQKALLADALLTLYQRRDNPSQQSDHQDSNNNNNNSSSSSSSSSIVPNRLMSTVRSHNSHNSSNNNSSSAAASLSFASAPTPAGSRSGLSSFNAAKYTYTPKYLQ